MTSRKKNRLQTIFSISKSNSAFGCDLTRRNWLKIFSFSVFGLLISSINEYFKDFFQVPITEIELPEEFILNAKTAKNSIRTISRTVKLNTYKFDAIAVNDRGQEVNRQVSQARYFVEDLGNNVGLDLVEIEGETFMMGFLQKGEAKRKKESPRHLVTVPSFYMAKFPITQAQWKEVANLPAIEKELNSNPSLFEGDQLPVERVSWSDAVEFCRRLSQATGKNYRLPSEAEWEYAARARTTTPFHFGETITSDLANIPGISQYAIDILSS